jgi:tRNA-dihydrouridine synthase
MSAFNVHLQWLTVGTEWLENGTFKLAGECDAIDLNLGCPQRIAHSGHFGSYLLGVEDRALVVSIVKTLAEGLSIPVFCKIRLLESVMETVELCRALAAAGCKLIAVHGRYVAATIRRLQCVGCNA